MNINENYQTIKEVLDKGGVYTGLTSGISMEPLIHHQKDTIIVVKPQGRLKNMTCLFMFLQKENI